MEPFDDRPAFEPTVLGAMWRFRWFVLLVVVLTVALAFGYSLSRPERHEAFAALIIEDPSASALFAQGASQRPERYVANQVAFLQSAEVAERAAEIAGTTADDVFESLSLSFDTSSDEIGIFYQADTPEQAVRGANAVLTAYEELRKEVAAATFQTAIEQLNESIAAQRDELRNIQAQIAAATGTSEARRALNDQFQQSLARVAELQSELVEADPASDEAAQLRTQLDDVLQQFQMLQLVGSLESQQPELAPLLQQQREAITRESELIARRDQLRVDAELASTGIVLTSPALGAEEVGAGLSRTLAVALVFGLLVGAGLSYVLALNSRRFQHRHEPELLLAAPLLAEVPEFDDDPAVDTDLPVRDAPVSASAEAFRFVVTALDSQLAAHSEGPAGPAPAPSPGRRRSVARTLAVVSAAPGDGKTVTAANLAFAAARDGKRVLAVDADFGEQRLIELLVGEPVLVGLTDMITSKLTLADVTQRVYAGSGGSLEVVSRGHPRVAPQDFFRSDNVRDVFEAIAHGYDLVVIDTPPLLHVAYATSLTRYTDRVIVVVPHNSSVSSVEEITERLHLTATPALGYIYAKAPLRQELITPDGSLRQVAGRAP